MTPWDLVVWGIAMAVWVLLQCAAGTVGTIWIRKAMCLPTRDLRLPRLPRFGRRQHRGARVAP